MLPTSWQAFVLILASIPRTYPFQPVSMADAFSIDGMCKGLEAVKDNPIVASAIDKEHLVENAASNAEYVTSVANAPFVDHAIAKLSMIAPSTASWLKWMVETWRVLSLPELLKGALRLLQKLRKSVTACKLFYHGYRVGSATVWILKAGRAIWKIVDLVLAKIPGTSVGHFLRRILRVFTTLAKLNLANKAKVLAKVLQTSLPPFQTAFESPSQILWHGCRRMLSKPA